VIAQYYGLNEEPFGVTPDPRFVYFGSAHREALASLIYGLESNRGFVALIAKPGMGKTSLLFHFLEGIKNTARTAFIFQTDCHRRELFRHILADFGLDASGKDLPGMHQMFNKLLIEEMQARRKVVLVIDEAQNLDDKALESIRLLSNFETPWMKLLHIVLAGQPELAERLNKPELSQIRQRVSMISRIQPFTPDEIGKYLRHRLWVAGYKGSALFTPGAEAMIASHSEGIPRNINNICFAAMSLACAVQKKTIDREIVSEVLADLDLQSPPEEKKVETKSGKAEVGISAVRHISREKPRPHGALSRLSLVGALLFALSWPLGGVVAKSPQRAGFPSSFNTQTPSLALKIASVEVVPESESVNIAMSQRVAASQTLGVSPNVTRGTSAGPKGFRSITVVRGQTLYRIILNNIGLYNDSVLTELRALNPSLQDPNQVQAGQVLVMPSIEYTSEAENSASALNSYFSTGERRKR
jgi:type II secretory pathway predicted ATPase ExeA